MIAASEKTFCEMFSFLRDRFVSKLEPIANKVSSEILQHSRLMHTSEQ